MATVNKPPHLPSTLPITGDEMFAMSGLGSCELIRGRIVPMPPTNFEHGDVEISLGSELRSFVMLNQRGRVAVGEVGIYTRRSPDTVRGADVLFISNERLAQRKSKSYLDVAPELIAEVLSPGNTKSEIMQKMSEYFDIGVKLVWLVDHEAKCVYAYRSLTDVRAFTADQTLTGDDVLPGFSHPVARLFE